MCVRAAKGWDSAFSLPGAVQGAPLTLLHHGRQPGSHLHPHPQLCTAPSSSVGDHGGGRQGKKPNKKQTNNNNVNNNQKKLKKEKRRKNHPAPSAGAPGRHLVAAPPQRRPRAMSAAGPRTGSIRPRGATKMQIPAQNTEF